jgi:hypothetical protein
MIRNLEKGLGIPAAILVQDYELAQDHPPEKAEPAEDTNAASQADEAWHTGIEQPAMAGEITH